MLNAAESAIAHQPDHAAIVRWLSRPSSYPHRPAAVDALETHMSRVFIAGDLVYKVKKPIRLEFVDFTSIETRRQNCERELALNQYLAPGIYREVRPLTWTLDGGLRFDGEGEPIEWLVVMNRLDQEQLLNNALARGAVGPEQIDVLCDLLARFYQETPRINVSETEWLAWWHEAVEANARSLRDPHFDLPDQTVRQVVSAERQFLERHQDLLAQRARQGSIVDGHGDLRPEHVHLGQPIRIIDRLEFNARLRWIDPFDEAVFLGMECKRLGAVWIGPHLVDGLARRLGERPPSFLLSFYAGYRATLRARLSIEHMRDPSPRTPERWPRQAREYVALAIEAFGQLHQS